MDGDEDLPGFIEDEGPGFIEDDDEKEEVTSSSKVDEDEKAKQKEKDARAAAAASDAPVRVGAVAVSGEESKEFGTKETPIAKKDDSPDQDALAKERARGGEPAASRPGVVQVNNEAPPPELGASIRSVTTSSIQTQEDMDREAKLRAAGRSGTSLSSSSHHQQSGLSGSSSHRPSTRRTMGASARMSTTPGVSAVTGDQAAALEERARRKAETGGVSSSSLRTSRRQNRASAALAAGAATARALNDDGQSVTTMDSDAQFKSRLEAKMAQMDQEDKNMEDRRTLQASLGDIGPEEPPMSTSFRSSSAAREDERTRRINAKLAKLEEEELQQEDTFRRNRESRNTSSSGMPVLAEKSSEFENKSKEFELLDMEMKSAELKPEQASGAFQQAVTTADPGIAVAPDVEHGEVENPVVREEQLAVAIAIDEEEEQDKYFPAAVEYDPDSKPPLYMNKRFQLYICSAFLCLVLIIVAVVVAVTTTEDDRNKTTVLIGTSSPTIFVATDAPTSAPTMVRPFEIEQALRTAIPISDDDTTAMDPEIQTLPVTPIYQRALDWIVFEDPLQLATNSSNLAQRFLLAHFYFKTSNLEQSPWLSCGRPGPNDDETCIFQEFNRDPETDEVFRIPRDRVRWLSGTDECEWVGVDCGDSPFVLKVSLIGQDLVGELPTELALLPFFQWLQVPYNQFTGGLPTEFATLRHLGAFEVHGNNLGGEIPEIYFERASNLRVLNIGENSFEGTLSPNIGRLRFLKGLHIFDNNLRGPFPTEVGNLRSLSFVRMSNNEFTGTIPSLFGNMEKLEELWLQGNLFEGSIPTEFGMMQACTDLRIHDMRGVNGTIPDQIWTLQNMKYLMLHRNSLEGQLSPDVSRMLGLVILRISDNMMTGMLPESLNQLRQLRLAWLHLNLMTGSLPVSICNNQAGRILEFLQTDCFPEDAPMDDPNVVQCECCSACCNRLTRICLRRDGGDVDNDIFPS